MNNTSDDAEVIRFYDDVFEKASGVVKCGAEHPPILAVLHRCGMVFAVLIGQESGDERAALFKAAAAHSQVRAAALILESWYVEGGGTEQDSATLLEIANERKLHQHPARKEAIVISIMTAWRQALMVCPIDRKTNTLAKAGFEWIDQRRELITGRYVRENYCVPN
jgi:hypothetical protein